MPKTLPVAKPAPSKQTLIPSPLWVWVATGLGALLGFLILVGIAIRSEKQLNHTFTNDAEGLLRREWKNRSDSVTRVIVLGTSLVEFGVADSEFFDARCGKKIRVIKVFRESVNIDAFTEEAPIFQLLERYPPDVLCIEENLLLFRLPFTLKPSLTESLVEPVNRHLAIQIESLKVHIGWHVLQPHKSPFQGFPIGQHQLNQEDTTNLTPILSEIRSRIVRTPNELPALAGPLQQLRQHGTQLVLLHIPRPAVLEGVIQGETRAPVLNQLVDYYKRQYQFDYWQFNQPLPFRFFMDRAHLNYLGNPVYSAWLADKLCPIRPSANQ